VRRSWLRADSGKSEWREQQILRLFMTELGWRRSVLWGYLLHYLTVFFSDAGTLHVRLRMTLAGWKTTGELLKRPKEDN